MKQLRISVAYMLNSIGAKSFKIRRIVKVLRLILILHVQLDFE